jgi:membrane protein DedA with SNARE-associated domain
MPDEVVYYVTSYGYMAIFILVFLQEIGMPNPFPNELLLIFSGYLSFKGLLYLPYIILTAISADFIGTSILYFLFFSAGSYILQKKPRWLPLSERLIDRLSEKISKGGQLSIYIFRLTPFTRGYTSVITGLLQIKPRVFFPLAILSAFTWATAYVVLGHYLGPYWDIFISRIHNFKYVMLVMLVLVLSIVTLVYYRKYRKKNRANSGVINI